MMVNTRLYKYLLLMRFHKPIGIFLLLWPTLWAIWIASGGHPHISILIIFISGVVMMRAAGCIINDIVDKDFDKYVKRTKNRPLANQQITIIEALILFFLLCICSFTLVCLTNRLTIILSFIAVALAICYPFMKRYTHWPQLFLGFSYSFGIPMAFAAATNHIPWIAWMLFIVNILWTIAYDTQYAMTDREDDIQIGIKSTAVLFGKYDIWIIFLLQLLTISFLYIIGKVLAFSIVYYAGILAAFSFIIYQFILTRTRNPLRCFKAFLNNQWFGMAVFTGIFLNYL